MTRPPRCGSSLKWCSWTPPPRSSPAAVRNGGASRAFSCSACSSVLSPIRSSAAGSGAADGWRRWDRTGAWATAPATTPVPAWCISREARWRSSRRYLLGPRLGKWDKNGKLVNPITPHNIPMVHAGFIHPGVRLVRVQSRQFSGGQRQSHRHRCDQHDARGHERDDVRRLCTCGGSARPRNPIRR